MTEAGISIMIFPDEKINITKVTGPAGERAVKIIHRARRAQAAGEQHLARLPL